ncbi:unnamed protein product, partial [Durusdinium trenchii]
AHCSLDNAIGNGEVLYLKGQLRVVTTLAFLAVVHQKNVDKEVHSSLQHVMALGVKLTDRKEELFCGSSCGKDFLDALCALAAGLFNDLTGMAPQLENIALDQWWKRIQEADPTVLMELNNAVTTKDEKYTIRDNPSLKILLDTHGKSKVADGTAVIAQASAVDVLEAKQQQMESQAFDLTMGELEFDLQSFRVYQQK